MDISRFINSGDQSVHLLLASDSDFCDSIWNIASTTDKVVVARVVRGHKCTRASSLFDEFAAAFQFPYYFGENWNAFSECLSDLEWIAAEAVVIAITQAGDLLADASPEEFKTLFSILATVSEEWSNTEPEDGFLGRTLQILLQVEDRRDLEAVESRLRDAGIEAEIDD